MSNVVTITEPRPNLVAGARPTAIVPQTMDETFRLSRAICMAGMAPKGLDSPEKCMIAIMHGLEIGLTPMAALQRIAVVNGRPTIWGDGAIGLVRASGLCEFVAERIDGTGDQRRAICETKRKGEPSAVVRTFSVDDAKKAGLWGKSGPWTQYPERMLQMRARAFCLRDVYADVLGGLYLREEMDDNAPVHTPPQASQIQQDIEPPPAPKAIAAPKSEPPPSRTLTDPETFLSSIDEAFATAQNPDQLQALWDEMVDPVWGELFLPDQDEAQGRFNRHLKRLEP